MLWIRHLLALLMLPFTAAVLVPAVILQSQTATSGSLPPAIQAVLQVIGILLFVSGLALFIHTVSLFMRFGQGTLAPWDATQRLVVRGIYRYVRNPMITGVMGILLGQALVLMSPGLFVWFLIFLTMNMIYMPLSEEPGLLERFGDDYQRYRQHVPAWIPRLTPWTPPSD